MPWCSDISCSEVPSGGVPGHEPLLSVAFRKLRPHAREKSCEVGSRNESCSLVEAPSSVARVPSLMAKRKIWPPIHVHVVRVFSFRIGRALLHAWADRFSILADAEAHT
jgi:hypothetical protein